MCNPQRKKCGALEAHIRPSSAQWACVSPNAAGTRATAGRLRYAPIDYRCEKSVFFVNGANSLYGFPGRVNMVMLFGVPTFPKAFTHCTKDMSVISMSSTIRTF